MSLIPATDASALAVLLVLPSPPRHDLVARLSELRDRLPQAAVRVVGCGSPDRLAAPFRAAAHALPGVQFELCTRAMSVRQVLELTASRGGRPWLMVLPSEPGPAEAELAQARWRAAVAGQAAVDGPQAPRLLHREALLQSARLPEAPAGWGGARAGRLPALRDAIASWLPRWR